MAHEIFYAAGFAFPARIFPRAADGGNVFEPRNFRGDFFHFFAIAEFPTAAAALNTEKPVITRHGGGARSPVFVKRADIADEGSEAGDGGEQKVIRSSAFQIKGETAFGNLAA